MSFVAFEPPPPSLETWIERVPARQLDRRIDEFKQARLDGWDVTVLIVPGGGELIVLAARGGAAQFELGTVTRTEAA